MPEDISASTGSAPSADSGATNVDAPATSASSPGTGEQPAQDSSPASQIDIGWTLEDQPEQPAAIPDTDDDIEGMMNEPGLDPARAPGVVNELRKARQIVRDSKQEISQLKQQVAALEQFGGVEGVNQTMNLINSLMTNPESGTADFLDALHTNAYPAYQQMVNAIISDHADYAISQLQQLGRLPSDFTQRASLDSDTLALIPEHLRDIAKELPADVLNEIMLEPEHVRNHHLERELKISKLDANQRQTEERQWRAQVDQARSQGQESIQKLTGQYEQAYYSELAKWKPLGPEDPNNQTVYKMAVEGATADLFAEPKFLQMYQDMEALLKNAPLRRLHNEGFAADADERKGRQLAAQFSTRFGQILRERVKLLDGVFRDARAYRESQRSQIPQRTEISGSSSTVGQNGEPPRLTKDGKTNPQWLDWMVSGLPANQPARAG